MALAQLGPRRRAPRAGSRRASALLDEAMTVALGGETSDPLACGDACCTTLVVCDGLADLQRAAEWCEAVVEFTERRRFTPVQSWCRGDLRRACSCARATGRAPRRCSPRRSSARRTGAAAAAGRCRSRCSPSCACARAATEEAERLLAGLEDEPARSPRSCSCTSQRGDLALARGAARPRRAGDGDGAACSRCAARWRWRPATSTARRRAAERPARARPSASQRDDLRAEAALLAGRVAARARRRPRPPRGELEDAAGRLRRARVPARGGARAARARRASRPRRARRSRSPRRARARRLRAPRRAPRRRPRPPRCCASSAPRAARPRAASATS